MTLKDLKKYINAMPETMDDLSVVNGEFGLATDGNTYVLKTNEITTVYIDEKNGELQFLHQTDKDVKDILYGVTD